MAGPATQWSRECRSLFSTVANAWSLVAREAGRAAGGGVETKMRRDFIARKRRERRDRGSCFAGGREISRCVGRHHCRSDDEEEASAHFARNDGGGVVLGDGMGRWRVVAGGISGIFWCGTAYMTQTEVCATV